jgi:proteasome beta subunit
LTVILALKCANGLVVASDNQSTEDIGVRGRAKKIFRISDKIVWGGSGFSNVISDLHATYVSSASSIDAADDPSDMVRSLSFPVLQKHYDHFIQPPGEELQSPATCGIVCGISASHEPFILEVAPTGMVTHYGDNGFCVIGSGGAFAGMANALLAHFDLPNKDVSTGQLVAFRVTNAVIQASAHGVGPPVQLWTISVDEGAVEIDVNELKVIEGMVGGWQQTELESLQVFMNSDVLNPSELP